MDGGCAVFYVPRFAALTMGILVGPADAADAPWPARGQTGIGGALCDAGAVFVGTVLDVWEAGGQRVARFVVERPEQGARPGEILGVRLGPEGACGVHMTARERWLIVAQG
jgi:hypothetical protein